MAEIKRIHPLRGRVFGSNGVMLAPVPFYERISLRAAPEAIKKIGQALGVTLPETPGKTSQLDGISALWIGPDEWFITAPEGKGLEARITKAGFELYSAVAINHRNTGIIISGPNAANVLNSGCPRDLSLDAFPGGSCARTLLGKAEVILWRNGANEFRVECWRSFSDYVWKYLVDAARSA